MSPTDIKRGVYRYSFPRVSGDEPGRATLSSDLMAFSPRERG